jgi:hypothetical protein
MNVSSDLPAIYSFPLVLWVEDPITRDYVQKVWGGADIRFLIAGGNENIRAIVTDAHANGHKHVFGLIDRDFRKSNRHQWANPQSGALVFVPIVHEIENYLLDPEALAGCVLNTGQRTAQEINVRLQTRASQLTWWMACRQVIADLRERFFADFPSHPLCPEVTSEAQARAYIVQCPWFRDLSSRSSVTSVAEIDRMLATAHTTAQTQLQDGTWRQEFSGKELLHDVRDWIYTHDAGRQSSMIRDSDLAKTVAEWQVANGRVPPEVIELMQALRGKVGLP